MDVLPPKLTFENSPFALKTITQRWPVILAQLIDSLYRNRNHYHEVDALDLEDIKTLTGAIGQLRYEVTTNKPITLLSSVLDGCDNDLALWNSLLRNCGVLLSTADDRTVEMDHPTWFSLPWLFVECYLYRRIVDCVALSHLGSFDPFAVKKRSGLMKSESLVTQLLSFLSVSENPQCTLSTDALFTIFIQVSDPTLCLVGLGLRRCGPMSLTCLCTLMSVHTVTVDSISLADHVDRMSQRLVVDDTCALWRFWYNRSVCYFDSSTPHVTAIVLDNAGPELVADLCLAEFLLCRGLTNKVYFYPKCIPWFVSDVTPLDVDWLLTTGFTSQCLSGVVAPLADHWSSQWRRRFDAGEFCIQKSMFWTLPCAFDELSVLDRPLYDKLAYGDVNVIIFKGDLNYRKLVADRMWIPDDPSHKVRAFCPMQLGRPQPPTTGHCDCSSTSHPSVGDPIDCRCSISEEVPSRIPPLVVALRVAKADVAVGLSSDTLKRVLTSTPDWWTIGQYGFVQLVSPLFLG
ncbi:hypothetical protein AHF37_01636 [Paragonimus kellicotti]|nr:hypothetical protein AHF37_01636 [Paragonimus kellicotti]